MNPPLEIDESNIKEMVDHMPQYIIRAPWYATTGLEEIFYNFKASKIN